MSLIRSQPQSPMPWATVLLSVAGLWLAPVALGLAGLAMFYLFGEQSGETGLTIWFFANALLFSPLFSWIGWLIALPLVALALRQGLFGWASAAGIGAIAGAVAGALAESELAFPFGVLSLLALRAVLGRVTRL